MYRHLKLKKIIPDFVLQLSYAFVVVIHVPTFTLPWQIIYILTVRGHDIGDLTNNQMVSLCGFYQALIYTTEVFDHISMHGTLVSLPHQENP